MKEFPVTSRELWTLGGLQASSAFALSVAGWLAGFWLNAKQAVDLADRQLPPEVLGQWQAYSDMAFWGAILSGVLGLGLLVLTGLNVRGIIKDTSHV